jgi:hypothetical protein
MLFLAILHYKICGRPAQVRAWPEPSPETEARRVPRDGHGQEFLGLKKPGFFGLARGMLRSISDTTASSSSDSVARTCEERNELGQHRKASRQ